MKHGILIGLTWLVLLMGPGEQAWAAKSPPPTPEERLGTHGYVFVRLITNAATVSAKAGRFQRLSVISRTENGKSYDLVQSGLQLRAQAFAAWLPPGEYELGELGADTRQAVMIGTRMGLTSLLPPFQVAQGKRTDLGTLIYQPVGDGKATVLHVVSSAENAEDLEQHFFLDARLFANVAPLIWEPGGPFRFDPRPVNVATTDSLVAYVLIAIDVKKNRPAAKLQWAGATSSAEMLALARRATVQAYGRAESADGTLYVSSSMGQILKRAPDGTWTNLDTGILRDILALAVDDETIVVGTEGGMVLTSRDGGATFSVAARSSDRGIVWSIDRLAADRWAVLSQTINGPDISTHIYFTSSLESLPGTPAKTFEQHLGKIRWSDFLPAASAVRGTSKYFVTVPPKKQFAYDLGTQTWQELKGKTRKGRLFANNGNNLLLSYYPPVISKDGGATWTPFTWPGSNPTVVMRSAKEGIALLVSRGPMTSSQTIKMTADGGVTWSPVLREFSGNLCNFILLNEKLGQYYCMMTDGSIVSTEDGRIWTVERVVN
jgi:hypothetical protein